MKKENKLKSKNHIFSGILKGIAPILQGRHPTPEEEEKIKEMENKRGTVKKRPLTDEEQYKMHQYRLGNGKGKYYQPSDMIEAAMVKAATSYRIPGEGKKSYKDLFKAGILVSPPEIVHKNQKFYADKRWGTNPNTGGAIWVVRPRCDEWELSFNIEVLQWERIPDETVLEVLQYAGQYVGIGCWRPKFGRFLVKDWKRIN